MRRASLLALLSLSVIAGCAMPPRSAAPTPAPATPQPALSTPTAEPIHIETNSTGDRYPTVVEYASGGARERPRVAYRLRALSAQGNINGVQSAATFEQPQITFIDRLGKKLIADSPQAKITQQDKSVIMGGGVHARAEDGSVLTCDTLRYDGRTEQLHGRGHVVLSGPNTLTLTGKYLEADVRLDHVRVAESPL